MLLQTNLAEIKIEDLFMPVVVCMIAFVVCIFITRAIFSIPTILRYYKANVLLNIKIARALGVPEIELDDIKDIVDPRQGKYTKDYPEWHIDNMRNNKPSESSGNVAENESDVNDPAVLQEALNKVNKQD